MKSISRFVLFAAAVFLGVGLMMPSSWAEERSWFRSFERLQVPPVQRGDTSQLIEAGTVDTDGFAELVFSLGGEFKEGIPKRGVVGALLVPDLEPFQYLLQNEGQIVFPLEATAEIPGTLSGAIFISPQQTARVAFPRYRVFLYNETDSGALVSLYVYRSR